MRYAVSRAHTCTVEHHQIWKIQVLYQTSITYERIFMYSDLKVSEKNKYLISLNLRLNGKQSILINYLNKVEI